jgi:hypothetical protein
MQDSFCRAVSIFSRSILTICNNWSSLEIWMIEVKKFCKIEQNTHIYICSIMIRGNICCVLHPPPAHCLLHSSEYCLETMQTGALNLEAFIASSCFWIQALIHLMFLCLHFFAVKKKWLDFDGKADNLFSYLLQYIWSPSHAQICLWFTEQRHGFLNRYAVSKFKFKF